MRRGFVIVGISYRPGIKKSKNESGMNLRETPPGVKRKLKLMKGKLND